MASMRESLRRRLRLVYEAKLYYKELMIGARRVSLFVKLRGLSPHCHARVAGLHPNGADDSNFGVKQ
jgi:hypothetical protein